MLPVPAKTPVSGLRFETKYLMDPARCAAIWCDLLALMEPDNHQDVPSTGYGVESLYFDTPTFTQYRHKLDGLPRRLKFRIRRYSREPELLRFEAKEKIVDRIRKRRTVLDEAEYQAIVDGRLPSHDDGVLNAFALERARTSLRPCVIVSYRRHAFYFRCDPSVRVTIDSDRLAQNADNFERTRSARCPVLTPGQSILELKWEAGFPHWLHTIVGKYGLRNLPLSKYCMGMEALMHRGGSPYA